MTGFICSGRVLVQHPVRGGFMGRIHDSNLDAAVSLIRHHMSDLAANGDSAASATLATRAALDAAINEIAESLWPESEPESEGGGE